MKKAKKDKKDKKIKTQKKIKLNGWLTALGVFAGVAVVSGATVLGVYLSGGFEEKIVMPESIAFEYDASLFNNGQLEVGVTEPFNAKVKQTFKMKITTPTERVTKNEVTLSFANQDGYNTPDSMGYISNTVIRLPQTVTLGEEFEVELLTENLKESENSNEYVLDDKGNFIDWIKGGISTIEAQSADIEQSPITLKVAVDVPVYKTETIIIDQKGNILDEVVTNQSFYLKSKYIPEKSQYMFSDNQSGLDESLWRLKKTFFESVNTTAITPHYQDKYTLHFDVGNEAENDIVINGYTYKTAYSQINHEKTLNGEITGDTEEEKEIQYLEYYRSMLVQAQQSNLVSTTKFDIGVASVENYQVSKHSQKISMKVGKDLRLFMNKNDYYVDSEYLGVDIYSTSGALLDGMLDNIAIAFIADDIDATAGTNASISVKNGENEANFVTIGGIKYYKPSKSGSDLRYSFWDLIPIKEDTITIKTVLLIEDGQGVVPFEIEGQEINYTVNLEISEHKEEKLAWTSTSDINVMLDYDSELLVPQTIDLSSLTNVPSTNIHQDVIFFVCFGTQDKIDYKETAELVLGKSGFDYEKSGIYATENGNFTLFAIEGTRITLYSTAEFTLYYATVVTNNGGYQLDKDGLYQIALMCEGSVRVNCEKSLNDKSVSSGVLNTDNFVATNNEVSINQGSDLSFIIRFTIGKESVPVFEDEYRKGYMTPSIMDTLNNDITSLFIIDSESFTVNGETGDGILEYRLKVKSAVQIENESGIYFSYIGLNYDDNHSRKLEWEFQLPNDQIVCVYKPISISIVINDDGGYEFGDVLLGKENVKVEQTLQANSQFATSIKVKVGEIERTFASVNEFLEELIGTNGSRVIITDQKGKIDTLAGQWTFKVSGGDGSIISISADGKSFTFKNTNDDSMNVNLTITSSDNNVSLADNGQNIAFSIISTGITHIAYSETLNTYDTTINPDEKTDEIAKAIVRKYGAKGEEDEFIVLADLINFYIANGEEEYNNVSFKFNPQYISESSLPEEQLIDMFGYEGMLTLYTKNENGEEQLIDFGGDYASSNIRNVLNSSEIVKIHINKNFAISPTLQFTVSDSISAVNTSFDLSLIANIAVSSDNYPPAGYVLYAGRMYTIANGVANYNLGINNGSFANLLYVDGTEYYIVYRNDRYVLTTETQAVGAYVGIFSQGYIGFFDFWDVEEKTFRVYFQPEGDNYYALNHGITFTITRDLNIQSKNGTFYVLSTNISSPLEDYVSVTRMSDGSTITGLTLDYSFSDYLEYDNGRVNKKTGAEFFFDYNQEELSSTLTIKLPNTQTILAQIPVKIKLYQTDDIYRELANVLTSKTASAEIASISAQTQIVDDVKYMMVDTSNSSSWKFGYLGSYYLKPSQRDYSNQNMNNAYEVSGVSDLTINFKTQNKLLAGLGDDSIYMVVKVYVSKDAQTALATMHIPMILSMIGYESVLYENEKVAVNQKLDTALTKPEELFEEGIYNEITAGKLTQILKQYEFDDTVTDGGLYTLEGFMQTIKYYPFDSTTIDNHEDLIKLLVTNKENNVSYGNLTLHHLANSDKPVYLALEYTLEKSDVGIKQTFYYLLKVLPDIAVEDSVYAYNGNSEYISGDVNELYSVNLDSMYDEYTLNEGYKRFNVSKQLSFIETIAESGARAVLDEVVVKVNSTTSKLRFTYNGIEIIKTFTKGESTLKLSSADYFDETLSIRNTLGILIMEGDAEIYYNNEKVFATLKFKNEIASVKVGDEDAMTSAEEWENYISLSFSADYTILYYRAKVENNIEIIVKHSYAGSASETDLAVVGGDQYYTLILNGSSSNYSVRFVENGAQEISTEYVVDLENGAQESYNLTILLIENDQAGGSQTGTIIPNVLNVQYIKSQEEIANNTCYISDDNFDANGSFKNYDRATGSFEVILKEYLEKDQTVYFAIYTEQGYLARLVLQLKANAKYEIKTKSNQDGSISSMDTLIGGTTTSFADIFTIKLDGAENIDYTVSATAISGDKSLVNWNTKTNSIEVADLIEPKNVVFDFIVTFTGDNEGKTFKFSYDFNLSANITRVSSYTSTEKVVAGQIHRLEIEKLYKGTLSDKTTLTIDVASSNPAFESLKKEGNDWLVQTKYVSASVTVSLNLTINIKYGETTQAYSVVYSFVVEPSVKITANYPIPNTDKLEFEYIEDGTTFNNVLSNFFAHAPIFNDTGATRIVIENGATAGEYNTELDYTTTTTKPTIIISNLQNASIKYGDSHYAVNSAIASDANITFYRGTYDTNSKLYVDSGNDAIVEFTITFEEVSQTYTVYILKNAISVKLNSASNFVSSGEYSEGTKIISVNYETIYIDKTSNIDMFAGERIVYAEMSNIMADYANEYYLVFKNETKNEDREVTSATYYASYPVYFSASDQNKDLYYDLGYSMKDMIFVGAYLTSAFENAGLGANYNSPITVNTNSADADATVKGILDSITNFASNLFDSGTVTLANRVQLIYGQLNGKDILIDYDWYKSSVNKLDVSSDYAIDNIYISSPLSTFAKNDGSGNSVEFAVSYYFKPSIDIEVTEKATSALNYIELEVNKEYTSLAELFGVHHPTNNKLISPSDFATGTTTLSFSLVEYYLTWQDTLADKYLLGLNETEFKTTSDGNPNNIYLFYAGIENASKHICDYSLLPLGAKNSGDFVLGEIVYSSGGFTKTFYVVVKIVPDYVVKYGESSENATTEIDGSISNVTNIRVISELEEVSVEITDESTGQTSTQSKVVFKDFSLTGENGYVSIKHKNGSSTNVELSSRYFTNTMPLAYRYESTEYNNEKNIEEKIFYSNDIITGSPNLNADKWVKAEGKYQLTAGADATFTKVNQIIFGDQYYMLTGVDPYGYVYKLYFLLQASDRTPVVEGTISLVENGYFDVGVQYQNLSIEEDNGLYHINSLPVTPTSNDAEVKMINIQGIEAWLFNKEYDKENILVLNNGGGYTAYQDETTEVIFDEADLKYLELPKLQNISIETIKLYDPNDTQQPLAELAMPAFADGDSQFATAESGTGFFNGMNIRGPHSLNVADSEGALHINDKLWYVPRLTNTDIYEGTNTADVILIITLKYEEGDMIEYYDCPVNVNLIRELAIEETEENVVRDAQAITLTEQFKVPFTTTKDDGTTDEINLVESNATFINDTLEILIDVNNTATFEMTLTRNGEVLSSASVTSTNTGKSYNKTEYVSLSQYFGLNVKVGDRVTINNAANAKFFYITESNATGDLNGATTFEVGTITSDYIYVENADLLALNSYYNVTKYYVMNCEIEGSNYSYQVERNYVVTGYYYKMIQEFIKEIGFTMNDADGDKIISIEDWKSGAFTLRYAQNNNGIIEELSEEVADMSLEYVRYSIDNTNSTISGMTIGSAKIEDSTTGTITLGDSFTENQYIKVVLQMVVSGTDRDLSVQEEGESYHYLGTLNLSTVRA